MVLVLVIGDLHIPHRSHDLPAKFKKLLVPGKIQQIILTGNVCDRETFDYLRSIAPDVKAVRGDWDEFAAWPPSMVLQHGPLKLGVIHGHQCVPLGETEGLASIARKLDVDVMISGGTHRFEAFDFEGRFFVNPGSATGAFTPNYKPLNTSSTILSGSATHGGDDETQGKENVDGDGDDDDREGENRFKARPEDDEIPVSTSPKLDTHDPASAMEPTISKTSAKKTLFSSSTPSNDPPEPIPSFALLDIQGKVIVTYVYQLIDGQVKVDKIEFRGQQEN